MLQNKRRVKLISPNNEKVKKEGVEPFTDLNRKPRIHILLMKVEGGGF